GAKFVVEGGDDPGAGVAHLAGGLGVDALVEVPEAGRPAGGEGEGGRHGQKHGVIPDAVPHGELRFAQSKSAGSYPGSATDGRASWVVQLTRVMRASGYWSSSAA